VEHRDQRNLLLSSDLSDEELEVVLGFARPFGRALSLGGTLKAQRQSVAGLAAMGVGADVGLRALPGPLLHLASPWAEQLVFGLAVRNLVQPSLRLDRESVADPTVFRTGLGWHGSPGPFGSALVEVDVEKVSGAGAVLRSGFELRASPVLALRVGMNDARLTAGTAFNWHRFVVDYAYRENSIAAEHRVGLSYAFGQDVDVSRATARQKEDERLQARLEETYRQRRDEQIGQLIDRARIALQAGHHDEALELLASARTLAPDDPRARELERTCLAGKAAALESTGDFTAAALAWDVLLEASPGDSAAAAGARRARSASDARAARSSQLRDRFARALDHFTEGRLGDARRELTAIVAVAPSDSDAIRMLRRTDLAIARAVVAELDRADRALKQNQPADALAHLENAEALDPSSPGIASRRAEATRQLRALSAARPGAPKPVVPPAPAAASRTPSMDPAELDRLYRRGVTAQSEGRIDEAIRCWESVLAVSPKYRGVDQSLIREYLTRGMDAFADGRLDEAIRNWELVIRIDPGDARALGYLERAREQASHRRQILGVVR
jgi:tetratricopeptide (TPR) repeat protein